MNKQRGEQLFTEAQKIINGERRDQYGDPEDNHKCIATLWNLYLFNRFPVDLYPKLTISKEDVIFMIILLKVAREMHKHKRDNLVDMAGYLGLLDDMEINEAK